MLNGRGDTTATSVVISAGVHFLLRFLFLRILRDMALFEVFGMQDNIVKVAIVRIILVQTAVIRMLSTTLSSRQFIYGKRSRVLLLLKIYALQARQRLGSPSILLLAPH